MLTSSGCVQNASAQLFPFISILHATHVHPATSSFTSCGLSSRVRGVDRCCVGCGVWLSVCDCDGCLVAWDSHECVTRRKKPRPGIASNDNTMHVTTARSSEDAVKPNREYALGKELCECVLVLSSTVWLLPFTHL